MKSTDLCLYCGTVTPCHSEREADSIRWVCDRCHKTISWEYDDPDDEDEESEE